MDMGVILFIAFVVMLVFWVVLGGVVSTPSPDYPLRELSRNRNNDQLNADLICAKIEYYRAKTKALKEKE